MSCYHIRGGRPLEGRLTVQGAKNSALPILAATLLAPGESVIENCPHLSDVDAALAILKGLGCRVWRRGDTVGVDASVLAGAEITGTDGGDALLGGLSGGHAGPHGPGRPDLSGGV